MEGIEVYLVSRACLGLKEAGEFRGPTRREALKRTADTHRRRSLTSLIYALKQFSLAFYKHSSEFFPFLDFRAIEADHCLYVGMKDGRRRMLIQYVDNFIVAGSKEDVQEVMGKTKDRFIIDDLGNLEDVMMLGMKVKRDRAKRTISLTQQRYSEEILERFEMGNVKPARTPMDEHKQLMIGSDLSKEDLRGIDQTHYLQAVGSLMYLMVCTRPDLAYPVGVISRFSSDPRAIHWAAVKRILRYIAGTKSHGLTLGGKIPKHPSSRCGRTPTTQESTKQGGQRQDTSLNLSAVPW